LRGSGNVEPKKALTLRARFALPADNLRSQPS
jgi:hypothetical protein